MDTAKRDPHSEYLLNQEYDMLIIDEAHKLKNKKTSNYQFIQKLRKNTACSLPLRLYKMTSASCST